MKILLDQLEIGIDYYKIRGIDYINIYKKALEDKKYDDSLTIHVDTAKLNEIVNDTDYFIVEDCYCGFGYDGQGKINEIYLTKTLP